MIFHYPQRRNITNLDLKFGSEKIERVNVFDFLGLTISETLDWNHHINKITNKISKTIGVMKRIKRFISKDTLRTIYNSLILPHLLYCILTWGFNTTRLLKLQKKVIRVICGAKYNAHTDPLFKSLCLLKINDIFTIQCVKFFHKYTHNELPTYFYHYNFFERNQDIHNYNTRNRESLHRRPYNNSTTRRSIRFHIPKLLDELPVLISSKINTHSLCSLNQYMKKYMINNYESKWNLQNCYICNVSQ